MFVIGWRVCGGGPLWECPGGDGGCGGTALPRDGPCCRRGIQRVTGAGVGASGAAAVGGRRRRVHVTIWLPFATGCAHHRHAWVSTSNARPSPTVERLFVHCVCCPCFVTLPSTVAVYRCCTAAGCNGYPSGKCTDHCAPFWCLASLQVLCGPHSQCFSTLYVGTGV